MLRLSMDIIGFLLIIPILTMTKKGIPFEPVMWGWPWWWRVIGIFLIVMGFAFQLWGTF